MKGSVAAHAFWIFLFLIATFFLAPGITSAMTISDKEPPPGDQTAPGNEAGSAIAKGGPVHFLGWDGNKLLTTAGAFVADTSVQVIDRANSRLIKPGSRRSQPSVQLVYQGKTLVKIIIE